MPSEQERILAAAIYQIRILLSGALGSASDSPAEVRAAAHIAYALHNEALAIFEGGSFEPAEALAKLKAIDNIVGTEDGSRLAGVISNRWP